jgi:hypothetical protein
MIIDIARRLSGQRTRRGAALLILLLATACATRVTSSAPTQSPEAASVPRPRRVLVTDFQVDPDAVRQDQAIGLRLQRAMDGGNAEAARGAIAAEVQSAISDTVVEALSKAGLPAEHALPGAVYRPGDLVVAGRVLRIDEGNRTRRLGIGFGAGKSIVEARAELYAVVPDGPPVLLQTYDGKSDSGRKPGMAVGASMAVAQSNAALGALSAVTNVGGEARRTPVGKEAASLGHRLATDIGSFAAERGWISAASIPAWTR